MRSFVIYVPTDDDAFWEAVQETTTYFNKSIVQRQRPRRSRKIHSSTYTDPVIVVRVPGNTLFSQDVPSVYDWTSVTVTRQLENIWMKHKIAMLNF